MKSALQLQFEDLNGLPFIAGIIWFALLAICLLAIAFYLIRRSLKPQEVEKTGNKPNKESHPKGF